MTHDWVKFRTVQCGSGSIDVWAGDCINNPNNPKKHQLQLNTIKQCFRLNGEGEWLDSRNFDGNLLSWIKVNPTESAENIWKAALLKLETKKP